MKLKDKTAIITGASEGLGREIALKLAKESVDLALIARTKANLEKVRKEAEKLGSPKVISYSCDIANNKQLRETVKNIKKDFNKINILINNAGIWQKLNILEKIAEQEVGNVLRTNLVGPIQLTRLLLPTLKKQSESAIINISSRSGVTGQKNQSVYTASKWGVTGFTEVLKNELEGKVRVAGVYQGGVDTNMFGKTGEKFSQTHFIKPQDLADVIVFMLSRPKQIWLHDVRIEY